MKKLIMIISLVSLTSFGFAQGQRPQRPSSEEMIKKATEELSLTDAQAEQWTEIHAKYESSMKDRSKAQSTMKKMGQELEATLTEDQLALFKKMRESQGHPPRRN